MSASYLPAGLAAPVPQDDGLDRAYFEAVARHELVVQRCRACRTWQWGPEWICHACHSFDVGFEVVPARGRIFSYERVWHPVHPALVTAVPYLVVLVELPDAGNVRMIGNLLGDAREPVQIGAAVEAVFEDHDDGKTPYRLVQWKLPGPR